MVELNCIRLRTSNIFSCICNFFFSESWRIALFTLRKESNSPGGGAYSSTIRRPYSPNSHLSIHLLQDQLVIAFTLLQVGWSLSFPCGFTVSLIHSSLSVALSAHSCFEAAFPKLISQYIFQVAENLCQFFLFATISVIKLPGSMLFVSSPVVIWLLSSKSMGITPRPRIMNK